ncbi:MAG: cell wall-active antibiotics response protein LiaF [Calditrichota bacterium]|jgi:predicted membrane protein
MARSHHSHSYFWGFILILFGILFLLQNLDYLDVHNVISRYWPVILILVGLKILLDHRDKSSTYKSAHGIKQEGEISEGIPKSESDSDENYQQVDTKTYNNVFGDIRLIFDNQNLKQFFTNNVFGNIDLNFANARFANKSTVKVNGVFGDVEIILPANIRVQVKANYIGGSSRIFGEHESGLFKNISYASPASTKKNPVVYVEVTVIFGDIRIHN